MAQLRKAIELWSMEADIIAPECPEEAAALRRELARLREAIG